MERFRHVKHCLNNSLTHNRAELVRFSNWALLRHQSKEATKLLNSPYAEHANLADLSSGLVYVGGVRISTPQNKQAIVAEVIEVS